MFKVRSKTSYVKNYRKSYTDLVTFKEIIPKEKVVEKTFVIFEKGLQVNFQPITIIVGDNGCGKTSLIKNLIFPKEEYENCRFFSDNIEKSQEEVLKNWVENEKRVLHFIHQPNYIIVENNIHKNSHIDNFKKHHTKDGFLQPQSLLDVWDMETFSNGENNLDFLNSLQTISNALIVLDEPETSLSIKSQCKIVKVIKKLARKNQIIIITHSEILMKLASEVYDFEMKKYVETEKYLIQQKNHKK
jgi:predicted ATPase